MTDYLIQRLKQNHYVIVRNEGDIQVYEESFRSFRELVDYFRKDYKKSDIVQTKDLLANERAGLENIVLQRGR